MAEVAITRGELGEAQRHLKSARSMAPRRLVGEVDALAVRLRRQSEGAMFAVSTAMVLVSAARDAGEPAMVVQAISEAAPTLRDVARYDEARALAREGFDLARGLGHAFGEVRLLTESATQARFEGLFDEAEALLEAVAKRAARIGDMVSLAHIACERGHLYLARGESVSGALGDARVRVERLGLSENAEARRRLVALTRAVSAHGADKLLFHGARLEDYPPAVRALLAASG